MSEPDIRNHACTKLGVRTSNAPYESLLTGLAPGTIYYVRAYATNEKGTAYGPVLTLTTKEKPKDSEIDADDFEGENNWD